MAVQGAKRSTLDCLSPLELQGMLTSEGLVMTESAAPPYPLRRLRWRLTFSYTMVTVAALLVVEVALLIVLFLFLNSDTITQEVVKTVRDGFVPQAGTFLESTPADIGGLNLWLQTTVDSSVATTSGGRRLTEGLSINFDQDYQIVVVDREGKLIAQSVEGYHQAALGEPYNDTGPLPGLISQALTSTATGDCQFDSSAVRGCSDSPPGF